MQFVPLVLCGVGLIALLVALWRPRRGTLLALRGAIGLLMLGSLVGVYEHLATNVAFELELRPSAVWSAVWFQALRGPAPLLAPGILAVAAPIAIAATYAHPALARQDDLGAALCQESRTDDPAIGWCHHESAQVCCYACEQSVPARG